MYNYLSILTMSREKTSGSTISNQEQNFDDAVTKIQAKCNKK